MDRVARFLGWSALATLVAGATLELTVRIDDWAQFGVPLTAPAIAMPELAARDSLGFHARPGVQFRQFRINALGFRSAEFDPATFQGSLVITAGASETFGLYESPGREWPRQLEDSLAGCRPTVRVLNAAYAGMSLPTVRQDFTRRLQQLSPRVIVYYPTPMQYLVTPLPTPAEPVAEPPAPLSPWRSRALPRFRDAFKRSAPEPLIDLARKLETRKARDAQGISASTVVEPDRLDAFERDLRGLLQTYKEAGVTPVVITHANRFSDTTSAESRVLLTAWERFYPAYTGTAIVRFDEQAAERTRQVGREMGVTVVDTRDALAQAGPAAFSDFSHFNDAGSAVVSHLTAQALSPLLCTEQ